MTPSMTTGNLPALLLAHGHTVGSDRPSKKKESASGEKMLRGKVDLQEEEQTNEMSSRIHRISNIVAVLVNRQHSHIFFACFGRRY